LVGCVRCGPFNIFPLLVCFSTGFSKISWGRFLSPIQGKISVFSFLGPKNKPNIQWKHRPSFFPLFLDPLSPLVLWLFPPPSIVRRWGIPFSFLFWGSPNELGVFFFQPAPLFLVLNKPKRLAELFFFFRASTLTFGVAYFFEIFMGCSLQSPIFFEEFPQEVMKPCIEYFLPPDIINKQSDFWYSRTWRSLSFFGNFHGFFFFLATWNSLLFDFLYLVKDFLPYFPEFSSGPSLPPAVPT